MKNIIKPNNSYFTAVIMAAGMGTRFGSYTENKPKGFVEISGKPMIIRSIETLISCGVNRIIIGTGYKKEFFENLKSYYPQIECCFSPLYSETNSMYTLYNCRNIIGNDNFILLESDIIYERKAIISLLDSEYNNAILISPVTKIRDQYYVEMNRNRILTNCSTNKSELKVSGELVGIHKISNIFYKQMCSEYSKTLPDKLKLGYEYELLYMSIYIAPMNVIKMSKLKWYEIDDADDLKYAEENIISTID